MMYALNLAEDGRILSVTYAKYAPANAILVDHLPEGNAYDYLCKVSIIEQDGEEVVYIEYIYDPLPQPVEPAPEPTTDDVLNALLGVNV